MKKYYFLIIVALILGLVLTGCTLLSNVGQVPSSEQSGIAYLTKGTETVPDEFPLYAGQTILVGTVYVWDDGTDLTITYDTTDSGWVMTETHLAVVTTIGDFPTTKKGNPKVGHFPYQCCYDETEGKWLFVKKPETLIGTCDAEDLTNSTLTEITYTIPLGTDPELFIAAQAVVVDMNIDSKTEVVVVSRPDEIDVYGPLNSYVGLGDPLWGPPITAVATLPHSLWAPISLLIPDATWISTTYEQEDPVEARWRWFHDEITLPEKGIYISNGMVVATADNAEEFYFNEESIGSSQHWPTITTYSIEPKPGTNNLDFIVKNWGGYTGLIYKATIVYYPEESAWAGTEEGKIQFSGENWATYFKWFHSTYAFEYDVPSGIVAGVEYVVPVIFMTVNDNGRGYHGVRFEFYKDGPGDVTFSAIDSVGTPFTATNSGFWGPDSGFDLPADYWATTDWTLTFSQPGEYTIYFSLIEAPNGAVVDEITGLQVVTVSP